MAKFYGIIGFAITVETSPGVWIDDIVEKTYTGDVLKKSQRWDYKENVNPDVTISDMISIIADEYTLSNVYAMKYIKWRGATWAISLIRIERPRIILEIGGLYSGLTP